MTLYRIYRTDGLEMTVTLDEIFWLLPIALIARIERL
jgi:hypothetical protein